MGDQAFARMIGDLVREVDRNQELKITRAKYQAWRKDYTWLGIQGQRYGQSFCNTFGITNHVLWYTKEWTRADDIIRTQYLANT